MSLRHAQRHVEASIVSWVRAHLEALSWLSDDASVRPFHVQPVQVTTTLTGRFGTDPQHTVASGSDSPVVGIAVVGQGVDVDQEVGGPLVETTYDLFVTVVAKPSVATALGEDITDLLAGRVAPPVPPFVNQVTATQVPGETLELQDVSSGWLSPERRDVVVVSATIVRSFSRSWQG